jgi:hypothetical protein
MSASVKLTVLLLLFAALAVLVTVFSALAGAQSLTTIKSGTITSGGTFQLVFNGNCANGVTDAVGCTAPVNRTGCTIVNGGTHNMFIWPNPNPVASATDAKAISLPPNGSFNCQLVNGRAIQDPIYIDGTTADAFFAGQQ